MINIDEGGQNVWSTKGERLSSGGESDRPARHHHSDDDDDDVWRRKNPPHIK